MGIQAASRKSTAMQFNAFVNERMDGFLPSIVERLDTSLQLPHAPIILQGDLSELNDFQ